MRMPAVRKVEVVKPSCTVCLQEISLLLILIEKKKWICPYLPVQHYIYIQKRSTNFFLLLFRSLMMIIKQATNGDVQQIENSLKLQGNIVNNRWIHFFTLSKGTLNSFRFFFFSLFVMLSHLFHFLFVVGLFPSPHSACPLPPSACNCIKKMFLKM